MDYLLDREATEQDVKDKEELKKMLEGLTYGQRQQIIGYAAALSMLTSAQKPARAM